MEQMQTTEAAAEKRAREQFRRDPELRREFRDNEEACVAYFKAEARGSIRPWFRPSLVK